MAAWFLGRREMPHAARMRKWMSGACVGSSVCLLALILHWSGWLSILELKTLDAGLRNIAEVLGRALRQEDEEIAVLRFRVVERAVEVDHSFVERGLEAHFEGLGDLRPVDVVYADDAVAGRFRGDAGLIEAAAAEAARPAAVSVRARLPEPRRWPPTRGERAGLAAAPATLTNAQLQAEIVLQRRLELAFEGHRWFDLKRRGQDVIKSTGNVAYGDTRTLAPLPNSEIIANKNLVQNPGY